MPVHPLTGIISPMARGTQTTYGPNDELFVFTARSTQCDTWNVYVGVPLRHPWYNVDYQMCPINCKVGTLCDHTPAYVMSDGKWALSYCGWEWFDGRKYWTFGWDYLNRDKGPVVVGRENDALMQAYLIAAKLLKVTSHDKE